MPKYSEITIKMFSYNSIMKSTLVVPEYLVVFNGLVVTLEALWFGSKPAFYRFSLISSISSRLKKIIPYSLLHHRYSLLSFGAN